MSKQVTDPTLAAQTERQTLCVEEVAKILGLSRSNTYKLVQNGTIPAFKMGSRYLIHRVSFERMMNRLIGERDA